MALHRNISKSNSEYTVIYEGLRGCNGQVGADTKKSYRLTENMYVDHDNGGDAVESIPGYRRIYRFAARINMLHAQRLGESEEYLLVHAGDSLYRFNVNDRDSLEGLTPIANLRDSKSFAVNYSDSVYILDGEKIIMIARDGSVSDITEDSSLAYVPTVYSDGEELEELNLLTDRFSERLSVKAAHEYTYGSDGIYYTVTDYEERLCAVSGCSEQFSGKMYIPSTVTLDGTSYRVTDILEAAFAANTAITHVITNKGLTRVGSKAFFGCTSLKQFVASNTVSEIGSYAFCGCRELDDVYLGSGIDAIMQGAFAQCNNLSSVKYSLDSAMMSSASSALTGLEIIYNTKYPDIKLAVPLLTPTASVERVVSSGADVEFIFDRDRQLAVFELTDVDRLSNGIITVHARADLSSDRIKGFPSTDRAKLISPSEAILSSRIAEVYDGRLFLSGNPSLGSTVFYSGMTEDGRLHPFYFGAESYFCDGIDSTPTLSLVSTGDSLAVVRERDEGSGSIFFHSPNRDGGKTTYPVSYIHRNLGNIYLSLGYRDKTMFLGSNCLFTSRSSSTGERVINELSHKLCTLMRINSNKPISACEWRGYLVIHASDGLYLGYPSEGDFDWYPITKVGAYENATRVYRYSPIGTQNYSVHENVDAVVPGIVYSVSSPTEGVYYYVNINKTKYAVYKTDEMLGGQFSPATTLASVDSLLFFGTDSGTLCVFNNDMRGIAPESISSALDFNAEEYKRAMGDRIHPSFYSFDSHAVRYSVTTLPDNCGIPELTKSTVPASLVLKLKSLGGKGIVCDSGGEGGFETYGKIPLGVFSFRDGTFDALSFRTSDIDFVSVNDRSRGWIEKSISVYSNDFCSPFGVYSISYRYKIKGRIKQRTE